MSVHVRWLRVHVYVHACVCACLRACLRVSVRVSVFVCARVRVSGCVGILDLRIRIPVRACFTEQQATVLTAVDWSQLSLF